MSCKSKKNLGGVLQGLSPLLGLIPGAGAVLSPLANMAGGLMNQQNVQPQMPMQSNTNPYGYAMGGYLSSTGPNTKEVIGNNPSVTDGVELPNANVDHGETISNIGNMQYVFSDTLKHPITGRTFAEEDKILARSDKRAAKKPNDAEARNTLKINQLRREDMVGLNEAMRKLTEASDKLKEGNRVMSVTHEFNKGIKRSDLAPTNSTSKTSDKVYDKAYGGFINGDPKKSYRDMLLDSIPPIMTDADNAPLPNWVADELGMLRDPISNAPPIANDPPSLVPSGSEDLLHTWDYKYTNPIPNALPSGNMNPFTSNSLNRVKEIRGLNPISTPVSTPTSQTNSKPSNIGSTLQGLETLTKALTLLRKPEKQQLYQNTSPINMRQYDPSQALLQNQSGFAALRNSLANSIGDATRLSNLQQAYANKYSADSKILDSYNNMNKQAQDSYEGRLAQRMSENNQTRYLTDDINARNTASYFNALRGLSTDIGNWGRAINDQQTNKQAAQWIMQAYPDIAKFFKLS